MSKRIKLPRYDGCFVCGIAEVNPSALQLQAYKNDNVIEAQFVAGTDYAGFHGVVHGGILMSLLDEISVWAASFEANCFCVTRELSTKLYKHAEPGQKLLLSARVLEVRKLISVEAIIENEAGEKIAVSKGRFFPALQQEWDERVIKVLNLGQNKF
jgi:uncharacterized protein (TIGR00369 family)